MRGTLLQSKIDATLDLEILVRRIHVLLLLLRTARIS